MTKNVPFPAPLPCNEKGTFLSDGGVRGVLFGGEEDGDLNGAFSKGYRPAHQGEQGGAAYKNDTWVKLTIAMYRRVVQVVRVFLLMEFLRQIC